LVVIGTSAVVQPAASIPLIAKEKGAYLVEINLDPTPLTPYVDERLRGPATRELVRWWEEISGISLHMDEDLPLTP
jgi:NAD-dependent SIR2 family protein deacetylase